MRDKIIFIGVSVVAVVAGTLVFLYGNGNLSRQSAEVESAQPAAVIVPFTKLMEGPQSAVSTRVNYLITSEKQLKDIWGMINATGTPPVIDFKMHTVLALFAGQKSTAGYAISALEVKDTDKRIVTISLTNPGEGCMLAQAVSAPFAIAVVPATSLPFTHEDVVTTKDCK